jgi:hypothetical protein
MVEELLWRRFGAVQVRVAKMRRSTSQISDVVAGLK